MSDVPVKMLSKRNCWMLSGGDLAVRPGLRLLKAAETNREIVGCFTVDNVNTQEVWHYIVDVSNSDDTDVNVNIYDDAFVQVQSLSVTSERRPRAVSHAMVLEQIIISSPDFPTLWGVVGGGIKEAVKVASDSGNTHIDIPRGLCMAWGQDRVVICSGATVYVSDAVTSTGGSPRTFIGANAVPRPGNIYGLHQDGSGNLVTCSTSGVWAWPWDAAATTIVQGGWQKMSEYPTHDFRRTAVAHGRVYGLTRRGYRVIDREGTEENNISEPRISSGTANAIETADYRTYARMHDGEHGPIINLTTDSAFLMADLSAGFGSWWTMTHAGEEAHIQGTLRTTEGDELLVTQDGVYAYGGNFDGTQTTAGGTQPSAIMLGSFKLSPESSNVIRRVHFGVDGTTAKIAVNGVVSTKTPTQVGVVLGTSTWNGATLFRTAPIQSASADFAVRTDEAQVEVGALNPLTRMSVDVSIVLGGQSRKRRA